jgi:hypothetical protein
MTKELPKPKIFVATPMYGGVCHGDYAMSLVDLAITAQISDIELGIAARYNESLIPRGRNYLVHSFLQTDCTHLVFIDSDIKFNPVDIFTMIKKDVDIIGGIYPKKAIEWGQLEQAVKAGVATESLPYYAGALNFNSINEEEQEVKLTDAVEVKDVPTGFMVIKRNVFEQLKPVVEKCVFRENEKPYGGETCYVFFDTAVDGEEYLSEDWYFCRKWQSIGGKVYAAPWCELTHYGTHAYQGKFMPSFKTKENK